MRRIVGPLALLASLSGCALLHPYEPTPLADRAAVKLCRAHCSAESWRGARSPEEADQTSGACWLACSYAADPWYIEHHVSPLSRAAVLKGCRYAWQDETTGEKVWDCHGGNRCAALPGSAVSCYRTPPSGAAVAIVEPPGCGGVQ